MPEIEQLEKQQNPFINLPDKLILKIFSDLDPNSLIFVSSVDRRSNELVKYLWKTRLKKYFPIIFFELQRQEKEGLAINYFKEFIKAYRTQCEFFSHGFKPFYERFLNVQVGNPEGDCGMVKLLLISGFNFDTGVVRKPVYTCNSMIGATYIVPAVRGVSQIYSSAFSAFRMEFDFARNFRESLLSLNNGRRPSLAQRIGIQSRSEDTFERLLQQNSEFFQRLLHSVLTGYYFMRAGDINLDEMAEERLLRWCDAHRERFTNQELIGFLNQPAISERHNVCRPQ